MSDRFVKRVFKDNSRGDQGGNPIIGARLAQMLQESGIVVDEVMQGVNGIRTNSQSASQNPNDLKIKLVGVNARITSLDSELEALANKLAKVKSGDIISYDLMVLNKLYNDLFDKVEAMEKEVAERQAKGQELKEKLVQLQALRDSLNKCNDKLLAVDHDQRELQRLSRDAAEKEERKKALKDELKKVQDAQRQEIKNAINKVSDEEARLSQDMHPTAAQIDEATSKTKYAIKEATSLLESDSCNIAVPVTAPTTTALTVIASTVTDPTVTAATVTALTATSATVTAIPATAPTTTAPTTAAPIVTADSSNINTTQEDCEEVSNVTVAAAFNNAILHSGGALFSKKTLGFGDELTFSQSQVSNGTVVGNDTVAANCTATGGNGTVLGNGTIPLGSLNISSNGTQPAATVPTEEAAEAAFYDAINNLPQLLETGFGDGTPGASHGNGDAASAHVDSDATSTTGGSSWGFLQSAADAVSGFFGSGNQE